MGSTETEVVMVLGLHHSPWVLLLVDMASPRNTHLRVAPSAMQHPNTHPIRNEIVNLKMRGALQKQKAQALKR